MRLALEVKGYAVELLNGEVHLTSFHSAHVAAVDPTDESEGV